MSHARSQIRKSLVSLLTPSSAWTTVLDTRIPATRQIMPYLMVFPDTETVSRGDIYTPGQQHRSANFNVVGLIKSPASKETAEDLMDAMCEEIEELVTSTALQAKLVKYNVLLSLVNTELTIIVDEDDSVDRAEVVMSYTVEYDTTEGTPTTIL